MRGVPPRVGRAAHTASSERRDASNAEIERRDALLNAEIAEIAELSTSAISAISALIIVSAFSERSSSVTDVILLSPDALALPRVSVRNST